MEEEGIAADDMRAYCVEWWEANKEYWLLPPVAMEIRMDRLHSRAVAFGIEGD